MSYTRTCKHCGHGFHFSQPLCQHCARPAEYPNVYVAEVSEERDELQRRYDEAKQESQSRGADTLQAVEGFEAAVSGSRAVIARSVEELQRLATGDNEIYATFYQLLNAKVRLSAGSKWDVLRGVADVGLFPGYMDHIRFAALTLDGLGLQNYGDCFLVLRTEMIAHRTTVFEENSVLFMEHHNIKFSEANNLPRGCRATWEERGKLCVAKLAGRIDASTAPGAYSGILLRQGATSEDDDFVEAHIWGPMTIRTIERVILNPRTRHQARAIKDRANMARLAKFGVTLG